MVLNVSYEPVEKTKSKEQLGFIFGGIIKALLAYFKALGFNDYTPEIIKTWLYYETGVFDKKMLPDGSYKEIVKTLSGMNKKEASEFINKALNFIEHSPVLNGANGYRAFILTPELRYCWTRNVDDDFKLSVYEENFKERDESYLRYQRSLTCIYCGSKGGEAHHIKTAPAGAIVSADEAGTIALRQGSSGLGRKNPDWFTIPVCNNCHIPIIHGKDFMEDLKAVLNGLDIETFCRCCYYKYLYHY